MTLFRVFSAFILFFLLNIGFAKEPKEIVLWHSLAANLGEELDYLCEQFNQNQDNYRIKAVYKGEYTESLTSFAAAFRAKNPPAVIQVFEVGTASMLSPPGIIKPLHEVLQEQGIALDLVPALKHFYSDKDKLQALPFNASVPLIYYNQDVLSRLGVVDFPRTWQELEGLAARLKEAGFACAYTSAYPAWIQIEAYLALHGLPMFESGTHRAIYDHPALISHLKRLKNWQDLHYFAYGGRTNDATILFTSGSCPLFSQSSGAYASLKAMVNFNLGVAPLPLDAEYLRHNNVIGGGALWVVSGHSDETYRGIALFFQYLTSMPAQMHWYEHTGYIPVLEGVQGKSSLLTLVYSEWEKPLEPVQANKIPLNHIRTINDEALEAVFAGLKFPEVALSEAIARANFSLIRFERNNGR